LNQRVAAITPFVSRNVWEANSKPAGPLAGLEVYAGLDLSGRVDLSAFVMQGRDNDGNVHLASYFWTPAEGLIDRVKRDRAPYDLWVKQGWLRAVPGRTIDYEYIANDLIEICHGLNIKLVCFDRWRIDIFKKACEKVGLSLPLKEHGQGFKDMTPALDILEADLLNGRIRHGAHPVLTMCAGNAVVTKDAAGGRKLDKSKTTGRIDGMVALAMAEGATAMDNSEKPKEYKIHFI
jgi:phage terminase large subunit-like protein